MLPKLLLLLKQDWKVKGSKIPISRILHLRIKITRLLGHKITRFNLCKTIKFLKKLLLLDKSVKVLKKIKYKE